MPAAERTLKLATIKTADLAPYESVFQHHAHHGYYIIRCDKDSCSSFRFTEPPLLYRRAVKHFEKHRHNLPEPGEELTENDVFKTYAIEGKSFRSVSSGRSLLLTMRP